MSKLTCPKPEDDPKAVSAAMFKLKMDESEAANASYEASVKVRDNLADKLANVEGIVEFRNAAANRHKAELAALQVQIAEGSKDRVTPAVAAVPVQVEEIIDAETVQKPLPKPLENRESRCLPSMRSSTGSVSRLFINKFQAAVSNHEDGAGIKLDKANEGDTSKKLPDTISEQIKASAKGSGSGTKSGKNIQAKFDKKAGATAVPAAVVVAQKKA